MFDTAVVDYLIQVYLILSKMVHLVYMKLASVVKLRSILL